MHSAQLRELANHSDPPLHAQGPASCDHHPTHPGVLVFIIRLAAGASQPATADTGKKRPLALILEPTRDLAEQTHNSVVQMGRHLSCKMQCLLITGAPLETTPLYCLKIPYSLYAADSGSWSAA